MRSLAKYFIWLFVLCCMICIGSISSSNAACVTDEIVIGTLEAIDITEHDFTILIEAMNNDEIQEYKYIVPRSNPLYPKGHDLKRSFENSKANDTFLFVIVSMANTEVCAISEATTMSGRISSFNKHDNRYIIKFNIATTNTSYDVYISSTNPLYDDAENLLKNLQAVNTSKNELYIRVNENDELYEYWIVSNED